MLSLSLSFINHDQLLGLCCVGKYPSCSSLDLSTCLSTHPATWLILLFKHILFFPLFTQTALLAWLTPLRAPVLLSLCTTWRKAGGFWLGTRWPSLSLTFSIITSSTKARWVPSVLFLWPFQILLCTCFHVARDATRDSKEVVGRDSTELLECTSDGNSLKQRQQFEAYWRHLVCLGTPLFLCIFPHPFPDQSFWEKDSKWRGSLHVFFKMALLKLCFSWKLCKSGCVCVFR